MLKYLRYFTMSAVLLVAAFSMMLGESWMWLGFVTVGIFLGVLADFMFGDDVDDPKYSQTWILNFQLFSMLPLLLLTTIAFAWQVGDNDFLSLGAAMQSLTGIDVFANRDASQWYHYLGGILSLGILFGAAGTNVGHELTHRTWSKPAMITGRWLLAFTSDASFSIEHVYGHHKHIATRKDPATSRRGENAWAFIFRSTVFSYLSAWSIEKARLERLGLSVWSYKNKMHSGNFMTLSYVALFAVAGGWQGALIFVATSIYGKAYLEFINYVEHYGMVRVEGAPVEPRHSWNCNKRMSGILLYNLTRHSHHHAMGEKPFWELRAYPETPMMPAGYLSMIILAAVPPVWEKVMIPRVKEWDRQFAKASELELIKEANQKSGKAEKFTLSEDDLVLIEARAA